MDHETKQKILDASRKLFYEEGYSNTSVRQIADTAGVSTSVLFHHFINKRDILVSISREYWDNRKNVINFFGDELSTIDIMVLRLRLRLLSTLNDEKHMRLHADQIKERIIDDTWNEYSLPLEFHMVPGDYQDKTYPYDELMKLRFHYYTGALDEITFKFYSGSIPFNKKNIDHHIISFFNMFFNIPVDELIASIKRVDRLMNQISCDGLNLRILNDEILEYIAVDKRFAAYNQSQVVSISDIVFYDTSDTAKNREWLKEKYDKVIVLVKYYKLMNAVDIKGIQNSIDDFKNHVFCSYSVLKDKFAREFFVTSFIDNSKTEYQDGIINQFEKYGVDALKTLYNLNIHHDSDGNVIELCAFVFY